MKERLLQLVTAAVLSIGGLILLFVGMVIDPSGQIHETVLVAFGEVATFAGSIIGIDYRYKLKQDKNDGNPSPVKPPNEGRESDKGVVISPLSQQAAHL